jgi:hypothetical protein
MPISFCREHFLVLNSSPRLMLLELLRYDRVWNVENSQGEE